MRQFFSNEELQTAILHKPFNFTKDVPVLKINRIEKVSGDFISEPFIAYQNLFVIRNGSIIQYN